MQGLGVRLQWPLVLIACLLVACPLRGQAQGMEEVLSQARVAQSAGDYPHAAVLYAHATTLSPGTPELWSNRGLMEYLAGRMEASQASLKHALRLRPGLFIPLLFLGKLYVDTHQPALALPYLDRAYQLRAADPQVLLALGKANAELHRQREAASFYSRATQVTPQNADAWFGLGVASLGIIAHDGGVLAASQPQSAWTRALYADELFAQGRPMEAVDTYKAVLATASPAQAATLTYNLLWLQAHPALIALPVKSQESLQHLNEERKAGQALAPACQATSPAGAACAYWAGDYEDSAAQAARMLRQPSPGAEALYWSVKANERIAVAALSRFEELAPHSAASYDMVGDLYRHERENDSALGEYEKALAIDAHDPGALMGAVLANLGVGQLQEAEAMDQTALADRPLDPQLNLLMAEILAGQNQLDKSKPYLAKTERVPAELEPRVHLLLARVAAQDGRTEEAIRQFVLALPGDQDGSIHYQLSRLYRKAGKLAQAQKTEADAKMLIKQRYAHAMVAVREVTPATP
jgi:tetratricopeptide (TPR) repeat protein